ncbi:DUF1378 family protein, partial [Escherichia coli]|uniref:DUF1378 family protein n=1 Tax=Escherichia coli TaxID=562 RepID=UPI003CC91B72
MDAGGGDTYGEKRCERYFRNSGFLMKTVLIVNNNGKKIMTFLNQLMLYFCTVVCVL